jgi:chorismate synthase
MQTYVILSPEFAMNGNSFGTIFRITTWGESHGPALGVVIDGCPSGLSLSVEDFHADLARRQGGGASFATPRKEADEVEIESGVFEGLTTGTPIALRIRNLSQKSGDYESLKNIFRPGHADLTTYLKHGHRDHRGGGRSSARETTARVAAGVVAKKILSSLKVEIAAWVSRVGPVALESAEELSLADIRKARDTSALGLAVPDTGSLAETVNRLRSAGDSWGGAVECRVEGLPAGIGEPIFDKLGALLGHALLSLPAATAFEAGGGAHMSELPGSAIRDPIEQTANGPRPAENKHGGLLGGMTTGSPLRLSVAFHAPTSIPRPISTVNKKGESEEIVVGGRHDAFPLPRALPMVEAMVAITLVDALLRAGRIPEKL